MTEAELAELREQMLTEIAAHSVLASARLGKGELAPCVLEAIGRVPRHDFVPLELAPLAYVDSPLPIGYGKTISQPFIVAVMTDLLEVAPRDVVLEVGTGLGYQAAILSALGRRVYTIELIEELALQARQRLARGRYANIEVRIGNGAKGWPEHAPFDKIIVTAAPELIPPALLYQLKPGGRMVIPAGLADSQQLMLVEKNEAGRMSTRQIMPVRFTQLEDPDADV